MLLGSESNVWHGQRAKTGGLRPALAGGLGARKASFWRRWRFGKGEGSRGRETDFLLGSESNVWHGQRAKTGGLRPALAGGLGVQEASFWRRWRFGKGEGSRGRETDFLLGSESNVWHGQRAKTGGLRPALAGGLGAQKASFWRRWRLGKGEGSRGRVSDFLLGSESDVWQEQDCDF